MRFLRFLPVLLAGALAMSLAAPGTLATAQTVDEAEEEAEEAERRAEVATGLVDEAIDQREELERELAQTITRVNEIGAELSVVGSGLDRIAEKIGFADVELANLESAIEDHAVDAYMTVLASPSVSVINSPSVEQALVASSVVEDVVASGREAVDALLVKRRDLETLQEEFLAEQAEFAALQEEMNVEVEHLAALYEQADAQVAEAAREAQVADIEYRAALSAVDLARAREAERRRQELRSTTTTSDDPSADPTISLGDTTTTTSTTTTTTTAEPESPPTSSTTTITTTTTVATSGGGGSWDHPASVEQWRPLVEQYFPSNRVEEALQIIDCESNGDPDAYNPYSGASGLFQFIPSTWATTSPKAGYGGASVFDPEANTASAAWLANRYQELGLYFWQPWNCKRLLD